MISYNKAVDIINILKERSNNEYEQIETVDLAVYS